MPVSCFIISSYCITQLDSFVLSISYICKCNCKGECSMKCCSYVYFNGLNKHNRVRCFCIFAMTFSFRINIISSYGRISLKLNNNTYFKTIRVPHKYHLLVHQIGQNMHDTGSNFPPILIENLKIDVNLGIERLMRYHGLREILDFN